MSFAIACSDDSNDGGDNGGDTAATEVMSETPSETMGHEETPGETMAANEVHISETEYAITGLEGAAIESAHAGNVTFEVHNDGTIQHSFYVIKSDLDEANLPLDGTKVDENGTGVDVVDEIETIDAGEADTLSVDLEPGIYVLICNIADHYTQGMHATLDVM